MDPRLVIGLTGGFGSGCTTVAGLLNSEEGFHLERLSAELYSEWERHHEEPPRRSDLQALGDVMRRSDSGVLARRAVERAEAEGDVQLLALDGIRNLGEIRYLIDRFGERFYLFAIHASQVERWKRLESVYTKAGLDESDFYADDRRDQDEEVPWGQQVQLCVDRADVLLLNDVDRSAAKRRDYFRPKLREYVGLLTGENLRYPTGTEVLMNTAFSAAHQTRCLKRQVGAVIATATGEPISIGFNENPDPVRPCVEQFGECYRDRIRNEHFAGLAGRTNCPSCGHTIREMVGPPWRCGCKADDQIDCECDANLENYFFPGRAMNWCTALHAEERAIINSQGRDLTGAVLYTTAFPCFLCAEKILQAGIRRIIFTEAYPDIYSGELLEAAEPPVAIEKFEGVRSGKFDRIFGGVRESKDREIAERRRDQAKSSSD